MIINHITAKLITNGVAKVEQSYYFYLCHKLTSNWYTFQIILICDFLYIISNESVKIIGYVWVLKGFPCKDAMLSFTKQKY